ncbi:alpha/beta hydrolase [Lactobacillus sp. ESL0791]|uniref:alpha/beta hydrolase n=1 Tax=Lactobacillus sp. ESL0791 TaxID=2983234 RepID=UPI0023F709D3|nr:alpha/beta hydrolase [Lactobacillus sp. ESL0791]MDF7639405.1 alpha/beta hydrolase [Lactobacillus sp. ESL0791]
MTKKRKTIVTLIIGVFCLLLAAGAFCFLRQEKQTYQVDSKADVGKVENRGTVVPTLYLHGWGASARSTNSMIAYAEKHNGAQKVLTATILRDGRVRLKGAWAANVKRPLIQVVMQDNKNGDYYQTREWFYNLIVLLQKKYRIRRYNIVAHSMGNLTTIFYQMKYGSRKNLPRLQKQVDLGGHFDGIIGMDDQPNRNKILADGRPKYLNKSYKYLLKNRKNYPRGVAILNIFGNKEDGTNSDGDVSVVSARSLAYLVRGRARSYREVEIKGANGQHSKLHENPRVDRLIGNFLW